MQTFFTCLNIYFYLLKYCYAFMNHSLYTYINIYTKLDLDKKDTEFNIQKIKV